MLYTAATRDQARPDSAIVDLADGPLAPSALLVRDYLSGAADGEAFRRRYLWELRAVWRTQPEALDEVIALATGGTDCTLVDGWPDVPHAPRHVLAGVLKAVARYRRRERRLEMQRRRLRPTSFGLVGGQRQRPTGIVHAEGESP